MLRANLRDLPWGMVFVGPQEERVRPIAEHWAGKLIFPTRLGDEQIHVGYSGVDPVGFDVPYTEYLDKSDVLSTGSEELVEVQVDKE